MNIIEFSPSIIKKKICFCFYISYLESSDEVQEKMNKWLLNNPNISIVNIQSVIYHIPSLKINNHIKYIVWYNIKA